MTRVLVAYASTHGHTGRIAQRLCDVLQESDLDAELEEVSSAGAPGPSAVDAVLVGGSVHGGDHQPELAAWIRTHHARLNAVPSALFSVSLSAAEEESLPTARGYADELLDATGWVPGTVRCFGGALQYREYGAVTRLVMRLIAHHNHLPDDVHHDVDFTDWAAVDAFARAFVADLRSTGATARL